VGERAGHAMSSAAGSTGRGMMDAARSAGHTISGGAHSAKNRMAISPERREHMKHRARDMAYGVRDTVEEHPLLFGGAALLVGLGAGLSAPPTRAERRVIGPIRDDLVDEVRHRAGDASESVGETLREVGKAAGQAAAGKASEENAGGIAQRAASAATAAVHTAGEKLREKV